ncbi:hypothetical protein GCM10028862_23740 [Luteimonas pelagia]
MTDIVLRDIDPALAARLRALSDSRGWPIHETLLKVVELGLQRCESGALPSALESAEADLLREAIGALEQVPDDPGFALIGRAPPAPPPAEEVVLAAPPVQPSPSLPPAPTVRERVASGGRARNRTEDAGDADAEAATSGGGRSRSLF